jgi:hypothetical protein
VGVRIEGHVVTVGKTGNIYFSRDLEEALGIGRDKAVVVHWDASTKDLAFDFVPREGRDRGQLFADGLLAVVQQGKTHQVTGKGYLGLADIPVPAKSVRLPAEVREIQVERQKRHVVVVNVGALFEAA